MAPQSTCKSIEHQVSVLPHWFIPLLLPLHLVGTSNSDRGNKEVPKVGMGCGERGCGGGAVWEWWGACAPHLRSVPSS